MSTCKECGQEVPHWDDIASELESIVLPDTANMIYRQMLRQAIRELREYEHQLTQARTMMYDAREEADRLKREKPPLSFEVVDVGTPGLHYNKQVIHAYPVTQVHWRVEIK